MRKSFGVFVLSAFSLAGVREASAAPNGYVSTPFADQVVVFDTADNSIVTTVDVGEFPRGLAVSPDGTKVYVANQGDETNTIASCISVIDTASNTAGTPIITSANGTTKTAFVAFSPDGSKAYASNGGTDEVVVIDTATDSIIDNINTGVGPQGLAVNHAGTRLYVANATEGSVTVIDTSNDQVVTTIPISPTAGSVQVLVTQDDQKVYVTNRDDSTVTVINASNNTVSGSPIPMDPAGVPYGLLLTPDGSSVAVFEHIGNAIKIIDVATDQVVDTVPVPGTDPFLGVFHPTSGLAFFAGVDVNTINPVGNVLVAPAVDTSPNNFTFGIDIVGSGQDNGGGNDNGGDNNNSGGGGSGVLPAGSSIGGGGCTLNAGTSSAFGFGIALPFLGLLLALRFRRQA